MTPPKQVTRYYVGPLDEISTMRLDGTEAVVALGDPITGTAEDAERWDAQPSNWSTSPPKATAEPTKEGD